MWWLAGFVLIAGGIVLFLRSRDDGPGWKVVAAVGALIGAGLVVWHPPGWYELEKCAATAVMPASLLWIALGCCCWFARHQRRLRWLLPAIFVAYTALGNAWLAGLAMRGLEGRYRTIDPAAAEPMEAIAVLGGGTGLAEDGTPQLGYNGDRLLVGARMFHLGKTPLLVTTGSSIPELHRERDLSAETSAIWRHMGIPETAILTVPEPVNTSEEIAELAELIKEHGWKRVGLVTSAWHMPRAMALARALDIEPVPLPADRGGSIPEATPLHLIPRGEHMETFHRISWELLGRLVGR